MSRPRVTVLLDTYNHERFIEDAVVSVLEQDFPPAEMEILVVDDGSTDRTPEIVRKFAPRVRYLPKENGGQASAFNFGIPQAQGEIVAFLDGDDWWAREKLTTVVEAFAQNPDVGAVGHGHYLVDEAGTLRQTVVPEQKFKLSLRSREDAERFTQLRCFLGTSRMAYRRNILQQVLPIPEVLRFEADEYVWSIAVALAGALVLDLPLFFYRLHASNHYMQDSQDTQLLRRRLAVMQGLADHLPANLASVGLPLEIVGIVLEQNQIDVKRLHLILEGGTPWQTYSLEQADLRRAYRSAPLGYRIYKQLSLLLALALPPRRFYQAREWYAANNLRRLRSIFGEPQPTAPLVERAVESPARSGER
ncbi:MAG: glycosyltransferase family 2 protein [Candidatus Acidiferrales bacterium]